MQRYKLSRTYEKIEPLYSEAQESVPIQHLLTRLKGGGMRENRTIFIPSQTCRTVKDGVEEVCKGDLAYVKQGVYR